MHTQFKQCSNYITLSFACRFFFEIKRRADAVKHLPGPEYGFFGILDVVRNKNCHRWATAMADKYGPIFKCRIFHYHVSLISLAKAKLQVWNPCHFLHKRCFQQHCRFGLCTLPYSFSKSPYLKICVRIETFQSSTSSKSLMPVVGYTDDSHHWPAAGTTRLEV